MKIYTKTLSYKLILLLVLITSIPISCLGVWSYWSGSQAVNTQFLKNFELLSTAMAQAVKRYLIEETSRVEDFATDLGVQQLLVKYTNAEISQAELSQQLTEFLLTKMVMTSADVEHGHFEILVVDLKGQVLGTTRPELSKLHQFSADFLALATKKSMIGDIYKHSTTGEIGFLAAAPIRDYKTKAVLGILINRIGTVELNEIIQRDAAKFGASGEFYIVNRNNLRITESRFDKNVTLTQEINTEPVRVFREKQQAYHGSYLGYRKNIVLGVSEAEILAELEGLDWLFLAEIDDAEAHSTATQLSIEITLFGLGVVIAALIVGVIMGRLLSAPIKAAAGKLFTTSNELSSTTDQHERTALLQADAVNQTNATMDELKRSAQQSISQAEFANNGAKQAVADAKAGAKAMEKMLNSMEELNRRVENIGTQILSLSEQTSQIGQVTEAVKDIANQTNLLALNAAVEATRAGEHGRGFTVVSQEIRKLAEQSKKSAEQISALVSSIQKGTNATVLATEAGTQTTKASEEQVKHAKLSFDTLLNSISHIAEALQQISLTAQQQSGATSQVIDAMTMINGGARETAAGVHQSKVAIQNLNHAAAQLQGMV